jgi:hypothetical protein
MPAEAMLDDLEASAVKDAAPVRRLSYYASQLPGKDTWYQDPNTGYRLYKDVPINRTGSQQYRGRELKKNPGYRPEWNMGDDEIVTVYRPFDEVTSVASLASFEAKSVLDEHPPDPQVLIDALDEYEGVSKGHGQNVRVGPALPDGETCTIADLWVKHPDLNIKIDNGVRDVSCGYSFRLDKDSSGRYIQREIRGNHIAIVPKGRAGTFVGIKDEAPEFESKGIPTMPDLIALGLHTYAKTATAEEFAAAVTPHVKPHGVKDADKEADEKEKAEQAVKDAKAAKDAEEKDEKEADKFDAAVKDADHDPETCDKADCAKCKAAKDANEFGEDGMTDDANVIPADERAETMFSVGDSMKLLDLIKPAIARSKDQGVKDAYIKLRRGHRAIAGGVKDGAITDPFKALTRIDASGGANDAEPEIPAFKFFAGKSHAEGLKAYNEYLQSQHSR